MKKKLEGIGIALAALFFLIIGNWANSFPDCVMKAKVIQPGETSSRIETLSGRQIKMTHAFGVNLVPGDVILVGYRQLESVIYPWILRSKKVIVLQRLEGWGPLETMPLNYPEELAVKDVCCIMGFNGIDSGVEVFDGFLIAVEQKLPCHIRIREKNYNPTPRYLLYDIAFDGEHFHAKTFTFEDSSISDLVRPWVGSSVSRKITEFTFEYMIEYKEQTLTEGDYYLLLAHTPTMTQVDFHDDSIEKLILVHHFYYQ